jgi:hypothetical protein
LCPIDGVPRSISKLVYTEQIVSGNLVVAFEEGGQKRLGTVAYRLDANVTREVDSGGGLIVIEQRSASTTVAGLLPDDKGRVTGELARSLSVRLDDPTGPFAGPPVPALGYR